MAYARTVTGKVAAAFGVLAGLSAIAWNCHAGTQCTFGWDDQFGAPAVYTGSITRTAEVYNDGNGAQLYVGGSFTSFSGVLARGVARFDGTRWTGIGQFNTRSGAGGNVVSAGEVRDMIAWDHDNNPATADVLVVCGSFNRVTSTTGTNLDTYNIAYWNGTTWTRLGNIASTLQGFSVTGGLTDGDFSGSGGGLTTGYVDSLAIFNIGGTPRLVATGNFKIKTTNFRNIAYWNGSAWVSVGNADLGFQKFGEDLVVHNDGTGSQLYVGGRFTVSVSAVAVPDTNNIAKFDGTTWTPVGTGSAVDVNELLSFDADGAGGNPALLFVQSAGTLMTWNGSAYTTQNVLGTQGPGTSSSRGLSVFNPGSGPGVYVGSFVNDGITGTILTKWDGVNNFAAASSQVYNETVSGSSPLFETAIYNIGSGEKLLILNLPVNSVPFGHTGIFAWNGSSFSNLPEPAPMGGMGIAAPDIESMVAFDPDGAGPQSKGLYMAGLFETAGQVAADSFARLDHSGFSAVAGRINDQRVHRLAVGTLGGVTSLFGASDTAVARLDGSSWSVLGADPFEIAPNSLATANVGGGGSKLYAAGEFTINGAQRIAQWNGAAWEPVGTGLVNVDGVQRKIQVVNENGSDTLWVSGLATTADGQIAKWDGTTWADVSAGLPPSLFPIIYSVNGQLLAVAGGNTLNTYQWDGTQWNLLASQPAGIGTAHPLGVADKGDGERLYAAAQTSANEFNRQRVRLFVLDNGAWADLSLTDQGQFMINFPHTIARYDLDGQASLFFGGSFVGVGGDSVYTAKSSRGIARWFCPLAVCPADFNGDTVRDVADLFGYINAWLAKTAAADFNHDSTVDVADLFGFINAWLAGC